MKIKISSNFLIIILIKKSLKELFYILYYIMNSNIMTLETLKQQTEEAKKLIQQAKLNKNKLKAEEQLVKQQLKTDEQYFKLSKSKSSLNKLKLKEKIDPTILKYLIASPFLQTQK